jgi:hypothetical protein
LQFCGDLEAAVTAPSRQRIDNQLQETAVTTETYAKARLRQRAMHELTELAILTAYLYITIGAVILIKVSVLHDHNISYAPWYCHHQSRGAGEIRTGWPCNECWRALRHTPADLANAA